MVMKKERSAIFLFCLQLLPFFVVFLFGLTLLIKTQGAPVGDYGNYFYGSRFLTEGTDPLVFYQNTHTFNEMVKSAGENNFFLNYTPVPPFSLLFYKIFLVDDVSCSKLIFGIFCLIVFCLALHTLHREFKIPAHTIYFVPVVFLLPMYSGFLQGQSYLFITALMIWFFVAVERQKQLLAGLCAATVFSLKIFPAFILLYPLMKRDWKTPGWTLLFLLLLHLPLIISGNLDLLIYYYKVIFPRLAMNDVTAPFAAHDQGIASFLLKLFVKDNLLNPFPFFESVVLAAVCMLVFQTLTAIGILQVLRSKVRSQSIGIMLLGLALLSRYLPVYSLVFLVPVLLLSFNFLQKPKYVLFVVLLTVAINLPAQWLQNLPLVFRYPRLMILSGLFLWLIFELRPGFSWLVFGLILLFALPAAIGVFRYGEQLPAIRPARGSIYDFSLTGDTVVLMVCKGSVDTTERRLPTPDMFLKNSSVFTGEILSKKILPYRNGQLIMCDRNNGVGMNYLIYQEDPE